MKTYNFSTDSDNTATYYITSEGDIVDTLADIDQEFETCAAKVVVDGFFVGSLDERKASAMRKYLEAKA